MLADTSRRGGASVDKRSRHPEPPSGSQRLQGHKLLTRGNPHRDAARHRRRATSDEPSRVPRHSIRRPGQRPKARRAFTRREHLGSVGLLHALFQLARAVQRAANNLPSHERHLRHALGRLGRCRRPCGPSPRRSSWGLRHNSRGFVVRGARAAAWFHDVNAAVTPTVHCSIASPHHLPPGWRAPVGAYPSDLRPTADRDVPRCDEVSAQRSRTNRSAVSILAISPVEVAPRRPSSRSTATNRSWSHLAKET